ncbi:ligand-binding sensor domain-containing protein [Lacibacter luteus]|uniref:ligand-binding sensor domain-containing protein n=1 Tax=Lacibacter luteus TaxID=2508719 RepID=UPI0013E9708C|nr:sensor histidine kinase [Lacibacter luteus]
MLLAQPYYFKRYQVENGLSHNSVICALQDKRGFMWFGTKDGLNRFDGYSFKTFRKNAADSNSIGNNFVNSLFEDKQGTLYVGTDRGLYRYNEKTEGFLLMPSTKEHSVFKLTGDANGNLWFISGFALCSYSPATAKLEYFDHINFFIATAICTTGDGSVWAGTIDGEIKKYIPGSRSFSTIPLFAKSSPAKFRYIETLVVTANGDLLAGTNNASVKRINPNQGTYTDLPLPLKRETHFYVKRILQVANNTLWLGTASGIFVYNLETGKGTQLEKNYSNPYSLSDNAVETMCTDKEGGVWVGTYFGGINYYPKQVTAFTKFFPAKNENSLSGNVVREIKKDKNGNLWIGTEDAGLNRYNPATGTFTHYEATGKPGSLSFFNLHGLEVTGNEVWIGTFEHGLDVLNMQSGKVVKHFQNSPGSVLASNFIYCIYALHPDSVLIGTTLGIYYYDRKQDQLKRVQGFPEWDWYTGIVKDNYGKLWATTFGRGIHCYNPATGKSETFEYKETDTTSLSSNRVNSVFKDSRNHLWFTTEDGLCRWNETTHRFTRYGTANGFPSNFMFSILEANANELWISTTKGLARFNTVTEKADVFTTANGLISDQFNYSSAYKDEDGRMYFGSMKGLVSFHPKEFRQSTFSPPVYITGFEIANQETGIAKKGSPLQASITFTDSIVLTHNQSTFSIDFAALEFSATETIQYAYQMKELSNNWVNLKKNRRVDFAELPAGTYHFRLKAMNSYGISSPNEKLLIIRILPPWWKSNSAYSIYFLAALLFVVFVIRYYYLRMKEKNKRQLEQLEAAQEKELLEMQLAKNKELLDAKIDFFTNVAHEIKTPLTLIKVPLTKITKKTEALPELERSIKIMNRNTNRLIELTNQLLDFRQTEIDKFHLDLAVSNITQLTEEACNDFTDLAEENNLSFICNIPQEPLYAKIDVDAFNKILYNLIGNAVKFAAKHVTVALLPNYKAADSFTIQVKNDGYLIPEELKEKIFEPFYRIRETETQTGSGIGLALALSLTQLHKGALVLDPPSENMNCFSLTLPLNNDSATSV